MSAALNPAFPDQSVPFAEHRPFAPQTLVSRPLPTGSNPSHTICLERLYDTLQTYLSACAEREGLLTEEDVRDLTSDVVLSVWVKRADLTYPDRYALRTCRHRLIRFLKQKRRRLRMRQEWHIQRQSATLPAHPSSVVDSETSTGKSRTRLEFVRKSLDSAGVEVRLIVHLRHHAGMNWTEIAEILGLSPSAARMKAHRFGRRVRIAWERSCPPS